MTLRIVNLHAENYKRLKAVDITPEGNIVLVGGRNAQGKTSVLDAIWAALAGGDASRATQQPIREGQDTAVVRLDLGDYIVTRRWTKDDAGTLTVETPPTPEGLRQKYGSPQQLLDGLIGRRAFDPLAFTRMTVAEQVKALVATVELPFDPATLERERAAVFDERTETNRALKALEAQLAGVPAPTAEVPDEEVTAAAVITEYETARAENAKIDAAIEALGRRQSSIERAREAVAAAELALSQASANLATEEAAYKAQEEHLATLPERVDVDAISARLTDIEGLNARVRAAQEHRRLEAAVEAKRADAAALTAKIGTIDKTKADALAAVTFPVPGLSFNETGVTLNGIPFSQASSAEQWKVSAALTMASNPDLRILQIRDGSLLDADSMKVLEELAAENDYQVWVEVVDSTGAVGVTIEDGAVA